MKKRLAIIALAAASALTAVSGASAALWNHNGPHNNAPAAQCGAADTACKILSTSQQGPLVPGANMTQSSSASHGSGQRIGGSSTSSAPMTGARTTLG